MIRDIFNTAISRYISFGLQLAIGVLIARSFGAEGKGFVFGVLLIPQLIVVYGSLSVNEGFLYYLASKKLSKGNFKKQIVRVLALQCPLLIAAALIYYFTVGVNTNFEYLLFCIIYIPILLFVEITRFSLRGTMQIGKYNISLLIETLVRFLLILLVIIFELGIFWIIVSYVFCSFVSTIYALRNINFEGQDDTQFSIPEFYQYGLKVHLFRTLNVTEAKFDVYLISLILPVSDLGIYSVAVSFSLIFMTLFQNPISTVILPAITRMSNSSRGAFVARVTSLMLLVGFLFGIVSYLAGEWALVIVYGAEFRGAFWPMIILLLGALSKTPMATINCYFKATGKPGVISRVSLITAPLNMLLCLILIPMYGIYGAAIASGATYLMFSIALTVRFIHDADIKMREFVMFNPFNFKKIFSAQSEA